MLEHFEKKQNKKLLLSFSVVAGLAGRLGTTRYTMRPPQARRHWSLGRGNPTSSTLSNANTVKLRGRHLLDHEALTCLLVLLFVDEPKLNTSRLHRVLRNLCYHAPTRAWIIRALLSMLQKTGECTTVSSSHLPVCSVVDNNKPTTTSKSSSAPSSQTDILSTPSSRHFSTSSERQQPAWLSISLDAALGCRANVFQMQRATASTHGKKTAATASAATAVTIHPQAAPIVCRHVLDTLISLAKSFPSQFLPQTKAKEQAQCLEQEDTAKSKEQSNTSLQKTPSSKLDTSKGGGSATVSNPGGGGDVDFWELLVRLDGFVGGKKGKSFQRLHNAGSSSSISPAAAAAAGEGSEVVNFDASPLGQLMSMLAHPVLRRSQQLTDRLLRLLGLVSIGLSAAATTAAPGAAPAPTVAPAAGGCTLLS